MVSPFKYCHPISNYKKFERMAELREGKLLNACTGLLGLDISQPSMRKERR